MSSTDRLNFFDLPLDDFNLDEAQTIAPGSFIASLNLENFVLAHENPEYKQIISSADLVIADGEAIVLAYNYLTKLKKIHKIAGIDLAEKLFLSSNRVAVLGSTTEIVSKLQEKYPEKIVFAHHGYFSLDQSEEIAKKIQAANPQILLVGMGAPRQEEFIFEQKKYFSQIISLAVGGSLNVLAGAHSRAPAWMIKMKLEWLFRILQEPFRLKRIFHRVPRFCSLIASQYFSRG